MGHFLFNKAPSRLYRHRQALYFRIAIPDDIRPTLGLSEFRRTLKTCYLSEARPKAHRLYVLVHDFFCQIRKGVFSGMDLTPKKMQALLRQFIEQKLEQDEKEKSQPQHLRPAPWENKPEDSAFPFHTEFQDELRETSIEYQQDFQNGNHHKVKPHIKELVHSYGLDIEEDSIEFNRLCREYLKVHNQLFQILEQRLYGNYADDQEALDEALPLSKQVDATSNRKSTSEETNNTDGQEDHKSKIILSEVIDGYLSENKSYWKRKTHDDYAASLDLLKRVVGDIEVDKIDRLKMKHYKDTLQTLPPNLNKGRYEGLSIKEIQDIADKKMSETTVNRNITRASQCFNWAKTNGYMDSNPAENMTLKTKKRPQEQRDVFTIEDLIKIFHSEYYIEDTFRYRYQFWSPVIALFTEMRIEDICQLHLSDIRQLKGYWVFDLFEKREEGRDDERKTQAGQRYISIHPFLVDDLNIIGFKNQMEKDGESRLFPELLRDNKYGIYSSRVSKWFNERYRKKCGIAKTERKTFHSFRHTFIDHLKQRGADPYAMHELDGHEFQGQTFGRYGKKFRPQALFDRAISLVDFESLGLDLSHLKRSKFTVNHSWSTAS